MKTRRPFAIMALVGVIGALLVAGTAFAQTPVPNQQDGTSYQEFFLDRLASALGVARDQLNSALIQARNETADQAVQDGRLTQEQAEAIKAQEGIGRFGFGFHGFDRGGVHLGGSEAREAVAQALGMTVEELETQLRSGSTLAELAAGNEEAVKAALVSAAQQQLDQAVQSGRITQEQADQKLEEIRNSDLSQLGGRSLWGRGGPRGGDGNRAPGVSPSQGPAFSGVHAL